VTFLQLWHEQLIGVAVQVWPYLLISFASQGHALLKPFQQVAKQRHYG
jgi:hypothetical protein